MAVMKNWDTIAYMIKEENQKHYKYQVKVNEEEEWRLLGWSNKCRETSIIIELLEESKKKIEDKVLDIILPI